jgi:hypothetical protein
MARGADIPAPRRPCNVRGTWLSTPRIFFDLRSPTPIG